MLCFVFAAGITQIISTKIALQSIYYSFNMIRTSSILLFSIVVVELYFTSPIDSDIDFLDNSKAKRGFRINSASRVAHGYGKRKYLPWVENVDQRSSSRSVIRLALKFLFIFV